MTTPPRPTPPPTPPWHPGTGSTSTNTIGGKISSGPKGGPTSNKPGSGTLGTSTNPIYGGGSTLVTPGDRGNHQNRTPGAPISHLGHQR